MTTAERRCVFLTTQAIHPPAGGSAWRNWQTLTVLATLGRTVAVRLRKGAISPTRGSAPGLEWTLGLGIPASPATSLMRFLESHLPLAPRGANDPRFHPGTAAALVDGLAELKPDVAVVSETFLAAYLPVLARTGCRTILDLHSVEGDLQTSIAAKERGVAGWRARGRARRITARERDGVLSANQVWVCSDDDAALVRTLYGRVDGVRVVPNGVDVDYYHAVRAGPRASGPHSPHPDRTLMLAGTFRYTPNQEAAGWLLTEIFPKLKAREPRCRLLLIGPDPTPEMQAAAAADPAITVTGLVPDIRPYLASASAVIVPLRHAGGTRVKILEAFAAGIPVVATAKASEGLDVADGRELFIADTTATLVEAIERLWADPGAAAALAERGLALVTQRYSFSAARATITSAVAALRRATSP